MELFIYLLKSMSILALFYLVYVFALRSDTYFKANRHFLLAGILSAIVLPFVTFTQINVIAMPAISNSSIAVTGETIASQLPTTTPINWLTIALIVYGLIMAVFIIRLGYQIVSLIGIVSKGSLSKSGGHNFVESKLIEAPFSFFKYIVYNPKMHDKDELVMIIKHEQVHVNQRHSADLLIGNLLTIMQWINPFAWWYKSTMAENLEFIADRETVANINCDKQYQLALVKNSTNPQNFSFTNHFYQSFNHLNILGMRIKMPFQNGRIKKRIVMLNKSNSNKKNQWKLAIILPLLGIFMYSFNVEEVTEYATPNTVETPALEASAFIVDKNSSSKDLDQIQTYFNSNYTDVSIEFIEREWTNGELIAYELSIKFPESESGGAKIIDADKAGDITARKIYYKKGPIVVVERLDKDKNILLVDYNGVTFYDPEKSVEMIDFYERTTPAKVTPQVAKKQEDFFGENPLYIINEKPWKTEDLPKNTKIVTRGGNISALNKEEGQKQYGDAGKDGVLVVTGKATFEDAKPAKAVVKNTSQVVTNPAKSNAKDIVITITAAMTKADLEKLSKEAQSEHGIEITIKNVNYNEGKINSIDIKYRKGGNQGSYQVYSDDGPIGDIFITVGDDGSIGISNNKGKINSRLSYARSADKSAREVRGYAERSAAMAGKNKEMKARMALKNKEMKMRTVSMQKEMAVRQKEMAVAMKNKQGEMRARTLQLKERQRALASEKGNFAYAYGNANSQNEAIISAASSLKRGYVVNSNRSVTVTKNTKDSELLAMKEKLQAKGVEFSYRKISRNAQGEITSIKLTLNNKKGSKSSAQIMGDNDEGIEDIYLEY